MHHPVYRQSPSSHAALSRRRAPSRPGPRSLARSSCQTLRKRTAGEVAKIVMSFFLTNPRGRRRRQTGLAATTETGHEGDSVGIAQRLVRAAS